MNLRDWKRNFLLSRGHAAPTNLPLFTYRMTKEEFLDLETNLRNYLEDNLGDRSLGDVAREDPSFCAAFVLYASEWWKRRFGGHQWSWTPILKDLGADPGGWGQSRRNACLETGFNLWNIDLSFSTGFHYLSNVAFNGGLPLQLIAEARGGIGRILSRVMRTASGTEDTATLVEWIDSLSSPLPQAYRREEIYRLLATIAQDIIELKNVANLTRSEGAVAKLDQEVPGWRERLPVALDDSQTSGLIEQLVSEAAAERRSPASGSGLRADRRIELSDEGVWRLGSVVDVGSSFESEQLCRQFALPDHGLEQFMTLMIRRGAAETRIGLRRVVGQERYRLERRDCGCSGADAAGDHSLVLSSRSGSSWQSSLVRGAALEQDAPWVFAADSPEAQDGFFVRQSAGKIPTQSALLCVPPGWSVQASASGFAEGRGKLDSLDREVWLVQGVVVVSDPQGVQYKLQCGHLEEEYSYDLSGARVWDRFVKPETAFAGIPRLERTDLESGSISRLPVTHWRYRGTPWRPSADGLYGPAYGQYAPHDETLWRGRLVLLPEGFRAEIIGGTEARTGMVAIRNSGCSSIAIASDGIRGSVEQRDNAFLVELTVEDGLDPPETVELRATWPRNPDDAILRLPFPSKGVTIHAADGSRLLPGSKVSLQELTGMRIVAFSPSAGHGRLRIKAEDRAAGDGGLRRELAFTQTIRRIELRMVDYVPDIRRILSLADSLDATVMVGIVIPDCDPVKFSVSQFGARLGADEEEGRVFLERHSLPNDGTGEPAKALVSAIKLNSMGSEPMILEPDNEGCETCASWVFPSDRLDPGPWLVFPSKESPVDFRPILWPIETSNIKDLVAAKGTLPKAIATIDQQLRMLELAEAIERMVIDPADPGWALAEWLAGQTSHLHLGALDLWRCFAQSGDAIAQLTFKMSSLSADFLSRFPDELPFIWELVPLSSWVASLRLFQRQAERLPESVREMTIRSHVDERTQMICFGSPSMVSILRLARAFADAEADLRGKHKTMRNLATTYRDHLFAGPASEIQKLLCRHVDDEWPKHLFDEEMERIRSAGFEGLLRQEQMNYRNSVANAPAILAAHASGLVDLGWKIEPELVSRLKAVRDFDPEWFKIGYEKSMIRCLAMRESIEELVPVEMS